MTIKVRCENFEEIKMKSNNNNNNSDNLYKKDKININKKNKKKLIGILALGGLILTAPFAAFAINSNINTSTTQFNNSNFNLVNLDTNLINEPDYDKQIKRLEKEIEKKIAQANSLISMMNESSVDIDELNEVISEFVKLETFLEEVQAEKQESDYLKEIFFDEKMQAINLTDEFRNILTSSLSEIELQSLREELKAKQEVKMGIVREKFTAQTLEIIDLDLAQAYANGEVTIEEVREEVKEIMDSMSEDEKEELFDEFKEEGIKFPHSKNHKKIQR